MPIYSLGPYGGARARAIIAMKERGRGDMPEYFGAVLAAAVRSMVAWGVLPENLVLVPAPTTLANERLRGGDPVFRACQASGIDCAQLLRHSAHIRDSAGLSASQRKMNISGQVCLLGTTARPVVLVDDVITTGATLAASAAVLHSARVKVAAALGFSNA